MRNSGAGQSAVIQGYATTTRTKRNIEALERSGWRLLLSPDIQDDWEMRYVKLCAIQDGLDNGAWLTCRAVRELANMYR